MSSLPSLVRYRVLSANSLPMECLLAALTTSTGAWIANPRIESLATMNSFDWIPLVVDEDFIGLIILAVGVGRLGALVSGNLRARMASAFVASCFWGANAYIVVTNNPTSALLPLFCILWLSSVWAYTSISYQCGRFQWLK